MFEVFHAFADGYSGYIAINGKYEGEGKTLVRGVTDRVLVIFRDGKVQERVYWGWVEGPDLNQNPAQNNKQGIPCDQMLARIFGGEGAIAATTNEPGTLNKHAGLDRSDHLADAGAAHLYANPQGTKPEKPVGIYTPPLKKGDLSDTSGELIDRFGYTYYQFTYNKFKYGGKTHTLTINFLHISDGNADGSLKVNPNEKNSAGSIRIGSIGNYDGGGHDYWHSHIVTYIDKKRTDPRKIFCK